MDELRPATSQLVQDAGDVAGCNALLYGISESLFRRMQSIQNAAARFLTGASRRDHISPVLRSLHWLPEKQRVDYKLATLVCKSLRG